jgi:RecJ-like exonuclease
MARALSPVNKDLSEFAIIGAIGDSQTGSIGPHWGLLGANKEILKDAEATGKVMLKKGLRLWGRYGRPIHKALQYSYDPYIPDVTGSESGSVQFLRELGIDLKDSSGKWRNLASLNKEEAQKLATGIIKERISNGEKNPDWIFGDFYELLEKGEFCRDANEFATILNACGKTESAWMGVGACLNDGVFEEDLKRTMARYRREIGKAVDLVRKTPGIVRLLDGGNYLLAGGMISEHIISNVASIVEKSGLVEGGQEHKPLFALAKTEKGDVKVSARISDSLVKKGMSMKDVLSRVGVELGGQGGGHAGAAGATIPAGSEERFIKSVENVLTAHQDAGSKNIDAGLAADQTNLDDKERINIKEGPHNLERVGEKHGRENERPRIEREGQGGTEEVPGREQKEGKARSRKGGKEMERQGLVRYLFS